MGCALEHFLKTVNNNCFQMTNSFKDLVCFLMLFFQFYCDIIDIQHFSHLRYNQEPVLSFFFWLYFNG